MSGSDTLHLRRFLRLTAVTTLAAMVGAPAAFSQTGQAGSAEASEADARQHRSRSVPEINGLVVDETLTISGRDFYAVFFDAWDAPEGAVNYTIAIDEQPVPGLSTRILVTVNDQVAFSTRLQPRFEQAEAAALAAVAHARRALANATPLSRGL